MRASSLGRVADMATAEQNTLLGLQLFAPVAEQFAAGNQNRVATLLKLIAMNREEQLRRDLASQGYDKSIELAGMQADREDARQLGAERRQKTQLEALQTREDTRATESERKQKDQRDAAEVKQLRDAITREYALYSREVSALGDKPRPRTDFDDTVEGLGELQAERAQVENQRKVRDQTAAADAVTGELDDAISRRDAIKKELEALQKPMPEDIKFATSRAADAVRQALETGGLTGAPKPTSDAAKKGLAALQRGDLKEAEALLGVNARSQFESAFETALQAAPNFKNRLQMVSVKSRELQDANNFLRTVSSDLRKAAATSLPLATKLGERRSALQSLQTSDDAGAEMKPRRTMEQIFGAPPAAAQPAGPTGPTSFVMPGLLDNSTNDPLISQENERRRGTALATEYQSRADAFNELMDQLDAMKGRIGDVRSGDPARFARSTNPMGGYLPGIATDPSIVANTLAPLLSQQTELQRQVEEARRKMLFLQTPGSN